MSNWGIGLGAGVQSAMQMYSAIQAGQRNALEIERMEKEKADTAALDKAWAESQGRVGQQDEYGQAIKTGGGVGTQQAQMLSTQGALPGNTAEDQAFERASAESAVGAMRENAAYNKAGNTGYAAPAEGERAPQAALPTMTPTEYTSKQGMADYVKAASQVSRKGTLEAIQMKGVMRESDIQDKFDAEQTKLNDTLALIHGTGESGGLKGLADAATKEGMRVKFVEGKNGVGSRIQVLGPKGDVLETVSDVNTATQKLSQAAMQQFMDKSVSLLGSPDKVLTYMQGEKKLAIQEREAADKGAYYRAAAGNMGNKGTSSGFKQSTVETVVDGVKQKVPVISHVVMGKNGAPQIQAFTLDGKQITDSKILGQVVGGGGEPGEAGLGADLASARKRYDAGNIDLKQYNQEVADIKKSYSISKALPEQGGSLNPNAGKAKSGKALPVATSGERQMDATAAKEGWKSYGPGTGMYFKPGPGGEPITITADKLAQQLGVEY
jgi:hypothetical protein